MENNLQKKFSYVFLKTIFYGYKTKILYWLLNLWAAQNYFRPRNTTCKLFPLHKDQIAHYDVPCQLFSNYPPCLGIRTNKKRTTYRRRLCVPFYLSALNKNNKKKIRLFYAILVFIRKPVLFFYYSIDLKKYEKHWSCHQLLLQSRNVRKNNGFKKHPCRSLEISIEKLINSCSNQDLWPTSYGSNGLVYMENFNLR